MRAKEGVLRCFTHHDVAPSRIAVEAQVDVVLEGDGEPEHEGCPRRDDIAVPGAL